MNGINNYENPNQAREDELRGLIANHSCQEGYACSELRAWNDELNGRNI